MPTVLPPGEDLERRYELGESYRDIADDYGTSRQAVFNKIHRLRQKRNTDHYLPWRIMERHRGRSTFARSALAHVKWSRGEKVTKEEQADANNLRATAERLDAVLIYDLDAGFCWRSRRPDDVDIIAAA